MHHDRHNFHLLHTSIIQVFNSLEFTIYYSEESLSLDHIPHKTNQHQHEWLD